MTAPPIEAIRTADAEQSTEDRPAREIRRREIQDHFVRISSL
ncbi:hypothetical protein Y590_00445 [Methylobacterium sp. AMS5]|nr:hypothetical protein Y590_00445 [Methylobacterium sp. AMS5]